MNSVYASGEKSEIVQPRVVPSWDEYFLNQCDLVATRSKDRSTQVGAIVVGPILHEVRSQGYNGFPSKIDDKVEERYTRPLKYLFTEHAERNAIYLAARAGVSLDECTMYVRWLPCADCARAIIQAGITRVVARDIAISERWRESTKTAVQMFFEAKVWVEVKNTSFPVDPIHFELLWPENKEE